MITKITGLLVELTEEIAVFSVPPFEYEVSIPDYTRRHLQSELQKSVSLHTLYTIDGNAAQGGKLTPS